MFRRAVIAGLLATAATAAHASDTPLYQPAPAWVTPAPPVDPAKLGPDAPIFLVMDSQQRIEDGELWSYTDTVTRAASSQALSQLGTISLPWQPDNGDLLIHRVEILRGGEHIDLLAGKQPFTVIRREQQLEQLQLDGMLTATMPVEGLRVGDLLHVTYSVREKDPALGGNVQTYAALLSEPFRIRYARDRLIWPDDTDLHWKAYAEGVKPELKDANGYHSLTVTMPLAKQPEIPDDAPVRFKNLNILEATTFDSWAEISKVMAPLYATDGLIAPGSPLAAEVARIEKESSDPLVRAASALALTQDKIRYLYKGMSNGNYVPQKPADTWTLRYGDCKAKTLLLLALLHAMDIEAEPVLASSTLGDLVPSRLPTAGAFDHVLVRATIGGQSLFLDGTTTGTQLADIHDVPAFRHVLPIRAGGADLLDVPLRASARPEVATTLELDQRAGLGFPAPYKASVTLRGPVAQLMRAGAAQASKDDLEKMAQSMAGDVVGTSIVVTHDLSFDGEAGTATVRFTGIAYPDWSREEQRYKITLDKSVSQISFDPDRARPAWRDIPASTGAPGHAASRTRILLPQHGTGFTLLGDQALDTEIAGTRIDRSTTLADGVITIDEDVVSTGAEIAPADIAATRKAVARAQTHLLRVEAPADYPEPWRQVAIAKKAGALAPILAAYTANIEANPDEQGPYSLRAWFRESTYDREGAIADLGNALALSADAGTYLWRARLYDALGKTDEAIADVKAAQAIDPSSAPALAQLANLEADRGHSEAALALVQERIDAGGKDKPAFLSMKAELLAKAGKKDAALSTIDAAVAANPGNPELLNSRCWIKGTLGVALDTALKDCTKSIELADSPAAALDSRAMVYFRMDRMEDALADLNAALDVAPGQEASMFLRGVIRKRQGDAADAAADLSAARLLRPQIDRDYARYGIKP